MSQITTDSWPNMFLVNGSWHMGWHWSWIAYRFNHPHEANELLRTIRLKK